MWILLIPLSTPHKPLPLSLSLSNFYLTSLPISNPLGAMDPVQIEKHQAMKRCRGKQLLPTFIQSCLTVVMLVLFLSSPLWLPHMFSCMKKFFLVSLPNIGAIIFRPKCLFIVSNIIIIFLIGESKLSKSPPAPDIYEEYVARRQSLQRLPSGEVKVVESVMEETLNKESVKEESLKEESSAKEDPSDGGETKEDDEVLEEEEEEKGGGVEEEEEEEEVERECEELDEEEEMGLPAEELNRRAEDFIAKFNLQRRLEARMLVCYG
ncbi:cyclin-dependent kinase 11A-like [Phoenix dactylifera]|uniref:Cyclin-dependent kinase 11A-like n=1 Tax=Phoenix dactylifera TaxID=42345 RepID=A0A8B7BL93_PHODC|nr:cyclin-dependent kinase 11A-like [Phoenix dactylifera]